jgi:hypothetical protein
MIQSADKPVPGGWHRFAIDLQRPDPTSIIDRP